MVTEVWKEANMIGIKIGNTKILSVYCLSNEENEQQLDALTPQKTSALPLVLTGDYNCRRVEFAKQEKGPNIL